MPQQQPHKVRSGVQARRGIRPCTLKSHSPGCQCPSDSAGKHRQHTRSHRHAHLPNTGCLSSKVMSLGEGAATLTKLKVGQQGPHAYNHFANGGGDWDQGMAGLDGPAPVDTWEGIGVSSFGAHLDGPDG
ncbi:hypothetical protein WJX84_010524 [Apatococcus fuscideae]|uniref:Uncharacterized protein n=1 Tax=Apatococcus fuscideae TaxID=2026836 RepID=A0AAW1SK94_9CHLO